MNERIKELAKQATTKISFRLDPATYKHIDDPDGDLERFEFDKEKFAELIVKECKTALYKQFSNGEFMYLEGCYKAITDHTGISGFEE